MFHFHFFSTNVRQWQMRHSTGQTDYIEQNSKQTADKMLFSKKKENSSI